jgi:hypothetical protein
MERATWMVGLWLAMTFVSPKAYSAKLPPIPHKPEAEIFKDAPAPWRDYLIKARLAERMADPLQRCLAYPDIPGNRWPAGHAEAHCRYHAIKVIGLDEIAGYLDRDEIDALDKRLDGYLSKHFSDTDFGEDIHNVFGLFTIVDEKTDRISSDWLKRAPKSAYANLARASFYGGSAWKARGSGSTSETPRDNFRRMTEFVEQATPLLQAAIASKPNLMPAYSILLDIASLDSRAQLEREAIASGIAQDPACLELANKRMRSLQPRWGGSYEQMLALSAELSRHVSRRPQLAIHVAAPYGDRGDRLLAADEYTVEAAEILDIAIRIGSNEAHLHDAGDMALKTDGARSDAWKGLAALLQETRFGEGNAWSNRRIASRLVRFEPEWSLIHASRAATVDPGNAYGEYLLGAGFYNANRFDDAERHYRLAMVDDEQKKASLKELSTMWLYDSKLEPKQAVAKAKPYIDRLLTEYPDYGAAWLMRLDAASLIDSRVDPALLKNFLRHADRKDPWQDKAAKEIEEAFRKAGIK